jgi:hypothetical protein
VGNEEVLGRVKKEGNNIHTVKRKKTNWIGQILRMKDRVKNRSNGKTKRKK